MQQRLDRMKTNAQWYERDTRRIIKGLGIQLNAQNEQLTLLQLAVLQLQESRIPTSPATPSANRLSIVCPKKVHGTDIKLAQSKGCFVTMKIEIADCIAAHQEVIVTHNASKMKPSAVKSTEALARELMARKRQALEASE